MIPAAKKEDIEQTIILQGLPLVCFRCEGRKFFVYHNFEKADSYICCDCGEISRYETIKTENIRVRDND